MRYADFEIWVGMAASGVAGEEPSRYPVRVFSSPAGPASGELVLDASDPYFKAERVVVRGDAPDLETRVKFGTRLFGALFAGDVRDAWYKSLGRTQTAAPDEAQGLRLRLWLDAPELAELPWELLWDKDFLAARANSVVSRFLPVAEPPPIVPADRLRVLLVVQSPDGKWAIPEAEIAGLEDAVRQLAATKPLDLEVLRNPSLLRIQEALRNAPHVFHFLGHGDAEALFFADAVRTIARVEAEQLGNLLLGRASLHLVVLSACNSAQVAGRGVFSGVGPKLVGKGVAAVVAMQYDYVYASTARAFSAAFYGAVAAGTPVDVAANEGRQYVSALDTANRDWSTPVVYLGTRSGRVLDLRVTPPDEGTWSGLARAARESGALSELDDVAEAVRQARGLLLSFKDVYALHQLVLAARSGFEPVAAYVESSGGNPLSFKFADARDAWKRFTLGPLVALAAAADAEFGDLLADVRKGAKRVTSAFDGADYGGAIKRLRAVETMLANADAALDAACKQALDNAVALSERTLGRLRIDAKN